MARALSLPRREETAIELRIAALLTCPWLILMKILKSLYIINRFGKTLVAALFRKFA